MQLTFIQIYCIFRKPKPQFMDIHQPNKLYGFYPENHFLYTLHHPNSENMENLS